MAFRNLAREYTTTTGTSNCVLSGAVPGCNTWEDAGVANGEIVRYGITTYNTSSNRPTHSEVGLGSYDTSTNTLTRTTVEGSTNGGAKIVLTGLSEVYITDPASNIHAFAFYLGDNDSSAADTTTDNTLTVDNELKDTDALSAVASNIVTIARDGWYRVQAAIFYSGAGAMNGRVKCKIVASSWGTLDKTQGYTTAMGISNDTMYISTIMQLDAAETVTVKLDNHAGETLSSIYVLELSFEKVGE